MKLLIIRFSSIGDIVLCTPVIRACKEQLKAEIHFLTKTTYKGLLEGYKYIDEIHSFESDPKEQYAFLKGQNYNYVIDLQRNIRSIRLRKNLKIKSFTFPKLNIKKWLTVRTKVKLLPDIHIVDRYFEAVKSLDVKNDGKGLDFPIDENSRANISPLFHGIQNKTFIALVIGATYYTKRIPLKICEDLIKNIKIPVVIIGGPEEKVLGEKLAQSFSHVTNTCGKYTIIESAAIIEASELIITGDTGMMHIAAALKKKIHMIWGNTIPEFGMAPYKTEFKNHEVKELSCRPCSKLGFQECPKDHFNCMNNQNTNAIIAEIKKDIQN